MKLRKTPPKQGAGSGCCVSSCSHSSFVDVKRHPKALVECDENKTVFAKVREKTEIMREIEEKRGALGIMVDEDQAARKWQKHHSEIHALFKGLRFYGAALSSECQPHVKVLSETGFERESEPEEPT